MKRVKDNLDRGLWSEYGHPADGYTAGVWYDNDAAAFEEDPKPYVINYFREGMPAFNGASFKTLEELVAAMRDVQPDLRKWHLTKIE